MKLVSQHSEWLSMFTEALEWCTSFWFARPQLTQADLDSEPGKALLAALPAKLDMAFLPIGAPGTILKQLYGPGLRLVQLPAWLFDVNQFLFQNGPNWRALLNVPDLTSSASTRRLPAVLWVESEEATESLGRQFRGLLLDLKQRSRLVHQSELERPDPGALPFRWRGQPESLEPLASGAEIIEAHGALTQTLVRTGPLIACELKNGRNVEVHCLPELRLWVAWEFSRNGYRYMLGSRPPEGRNWDPEHTLEVSREPSERRHALFARGQEGLLCLAYRYPSLAQAPYFWSRFRGVAADCSGDRVAVACEVGSDLTLPELGGFLELLNRAVKPALNEVAAEDNEEENERFLDEDRELQFELAHEIMLGQGYMEKERAVRFVAEELRAQGRAQYARLDTRSDLWTTIESLLRRDGFDRSTRGYVRAVLTEARDYDLGWWSYCALQAVGTRTLAREVLAYQTYVWAKAWMGLDAGFSRVSSAIDEAIDCCLRDNEFLDVGKGRLRLK